VTDKCFVFFWSGCVEDEDVFGKKKISQEKKMSGTILQCIPKENAVFKGIFHPKI